jgi:hypothetical protein
MTKKSVLRMGKNTKTTHNRFAIYDEVVALGCGVSEGSGVALGGATVSVAVGMDVSVAASLVGLGVVVSVGVSVSVTGVSGVKVAVLV